MKQTKKQSMWRQLPVAMLPSPVLAVAGGADGLWAAGAGGIARLPDPEEATGGTWEIDSANLPLSAVTALLYVEGWLIAGGIDGIAYSGDRGQSWQSAQLQEGIVSVSAFALSPAFERDRTILAATLESGILRSDDAGRTWHSASFGLQDFAVNVLCWGRGETVIAATDEGLYRSSNAGRAWRAVRDGEGLLVTALAALSDGTLLAALEDGGLLASRDDGMRWSPSGGEGVQGTALWVTRTATLLLSTSEQGLLASRDGEQWESVLQETVLTFAEDRHALYTGTTTGLYVSVDQGWHWDALPPPPIHDLRHILAFEDDLYLAGPQAGLMRYDAARGWNPLPQIPYPLTAAFIDPWGNLFASSSEGLWRSTDRGDSWHVLIAGEGGNVARFAFRADGTGWAGSADGSLLLHTTDKGLTWQPLSPPFGIVPLVGLLATPEQIIAATYDPRFYAAHIWYSNDDGQHWEHLLDAEPLHAPVTINAQPPLLTLGQLILRPHPGQWQQIGLEKTYGQLQCVAGSAGSLFALTTTALLSSRDGGSSWQPLELEQSVPVSNIVDIALAGDTLYCLLTKGRVISLALL